MANQVINIFIFLLSLSLVIISGNPFAYSKKNKNISEKSINRFSNQEILSEEDTTNNIDTIKVVGIDINKMKENNLNFIFFRSNNNELLSNYSGHYAKGEYICSWNIKDGKRKTVAYLGDHVWILSMVLSHNENYMIIATMRKYSRQLKCYSIIEEQLLWEIKDLDDIDCLSFSADDKEIVALGNDAVYRVDSKKGTVLKEIEIIRDIYPQHSHISTWSFFSNSGKYLVIWQVQPVWSIIDIFRSSANKKISVWDIDKEEIVASIDLPLGGIRTATFSDDERSVFLGSNEEILLWNLETNTITKRIPGRAIYMLTNKTKRIFAAAIDAKEVFELFIWEYPYDNLKTIITPFARDFSKEGKMPVNFDKTGKYCAIERGGILFLYDTTNWDVLWKTETEKDLR